MVFLEISQNSQENTARVSFLLTLRANVATLSKKSLSHKCFPVNFTKFLRSFSYRTPLAAVSSVLHLLSWMPCILNVY